MNWSKHIGSFGRALLEELGYDYTNLPTSYNPITKALQDADFVARAKLIPGFSRNAMVRVGAICQMIVYDASGGPEGDDKPKALRRHWYSYIKSELAQPLSEQLGEDLQSERWGSNWSARLSKTYARLVDEGNGITYRELWVEDASRMMEHNWNALFSGCNIIIAVEKDSLFADFTAPAKALGAKSVYSGKGKSSKAAIEKCLREHFGWQPGRSPFTAEEPLIILHISDYDFDGEAVIGPTFGEQSRRYTSYILEARVGIEPSTVTDLGYDPTEKWYQIKVSNKGYERWAAEKALFLDSWTQEAVQGKLDFDKDIDIAHGYEVEALKTRDYYRLLVDALLQVLPFDYIISRLRDECVASAGNAADQLVTEICEANEDYRNILAEFERLEQLKTEFEAKVRDHFVELGEPHINDWRDDDDDPTSEDFQHHVEHANDWSNPWRPFENRDRTASLIEWLREDATDDIEMFEEYRIM